MHCFASENQAYTETVIFCVESLKSLKVKKATAEKSRLDNVRFLSWRTFFVGKYDIQSTNEMAF